MAPEEPDGWLVASHEAVVPQHETCPSRFRFVVLASKLLETISVAPALLR